MEKGRDWVRAEVDAANGTALPPCDSLHRESAVSPNSPHYEYDSVVKGCGDAVDTLLGSPCRTGELSAQRWRQRR